MKKLFPFMNNQTGFFLPYVMFIVVILLMILFTNITTYRNEVHITNNLVEQIKIETLFQMARAKFREDFPQNHLSSGKTNYYFPYGEVQINYTTDNETVNLYIKIITDKNISYSFVNQFQVGTNK